jgi:uncharacterized membrane protein SpoIIM required for sporulation
MAKDRKTGDDSSKPSKAIGTRASGTERKQRGRAEKKPLQDGEPDDQSGNTQLTLFLDEKPVGPLRSTIFSYLSSDFLPDNILRRGLLLTIEALIYVGASLLIARALGVGESGVISVFLSAAVLSSRLLQLLEENRTRIWEKGYKSWKTNLLTAGSILAIFVGTILTYVIAAGLLNNDEVARSFRFALQAAGIGRDSILTRQFAGFLPILGHNCLVLFSVICLSFVYRAYGALLAVVWNACTWGLVITFLVQRGLSVTEGSSIAFIFISVMAVFPHLALEAAAYIVASMAAIFISKGLLKYPVSDERFRVVARSCLKLLLASVALLIVAALFETQLAPYLLAKLK